MSKGRNRAVFRRPKDGKWANRRNTSNRIPGVHDTHKEAEQAIRQMLKNPVGEEPITKSREGRVRSKDTITPGI